LTIYTTEKKWKKFGLTMSDLQEKYTVERIPVRFFREALGLALEAVKARRSCRRARSCASNNPAARLGHRTQFAKKRTKAKSG
jgi:hypothetical protein